MRGGGGIRIRRHWCAQTNTDCNKTVNKTGVTRRGLALIFVCVMLAEEPAGKSVAFNNDLLKSLTFNPVWFYLCCLWTQKNVVANRSRVFLFKNGNLHIKLDWLTPDMPSHCVCSGRKAKVNRVFLPLIILFFNVARIIILKKTGHYPSLPKQPWFDKENLQKEIKQTRFYQAERVINHFRSTHIRQSRRDLKWLLPVGSKKADNATGFPFSSDSKISLYCDHNHSISFTLTTIIAQTYVRGFFSAQTQHNHWRDSNVSFANVQLYLR